MSMPVCTSLDSPPADVEGALVHVRDQNWQQGGGNGDPLNEPRFVKSWSLDGGQTWNAPGPPPTSQPDTPVPGQVAPGMTTFDFRGLIPAGQTKPVLFEIAAGTHSRYVRQDGTVAYDVIEWGNHMVNNGPPVRFTVNVTNPGGPPPPSPPPTGGPVTIPRADLEADVKELEASLGYRLGWGRVVRPTKRLRARLK